MTEAYPTTLILVPTELERARLPIDSEWLESTDSQLEVVGFGVISAAVNATQLLHDIRPRRALLLGIGGTYDSECFPVGSAVRFRDVFLDGIGGVGRQGPISAAELGFGLDRPIRLSPSPDAPTGLLTVTATSLDAETSQARKRRFPECLCEDMEGYAVAAACGACDTPLEIVRGASNLVGDRNKQNWQIGQALQAAAAMAKSIIEMEADK